MSAISETSPIERVARVIAAEELSPNGEDRGDGERAVSDQVDARWRDQVDRARAVLRTLREPTAEMVEAGRSAGADPLEVWSAMMRAAIDEPIRLFAN